MAAVVLPSTHDLVSFERPGLRLVVGTGAGGDGRTRPVRGSRAAVVRRQRRLLAAGLAALAVVGLWFAFGGTGSATAGSVPSVRIDAQTVEARTHIVQPGDSLWSIARSLQPTGDLRPVVDRLSAARHGRPLTPGERITL